MSTNAEIVVLFSSDSKGKVCLYQHWDGDTLGKTLSEALDRGRSRWNDESYLTRIIFSTMLMDSGTLADLTGFGIAPYTTNQYYTWTVDTEKQTVTDPEGKTSSFEDFAKTHVNA